MSRVRRVFITGASTGIGAAMARHYASPESAIGLFARRRDLLEAVSAPLSGRTALYAAAARFARAIEARRRLVVIPWQMAMLSRVLRIMPGWLYDRLAARAPRKPRDVRI